MDSIILPERWQKSNERQIYAVPTGLRKIWGAVISINMALLAELPASDAIPLKTARNLISRSRIFGKVAFRCRTGMAVSLGITHIERFQGGAPERAFLRSHVDDESACDDAADGVSYGAVCGAS